MKNPTEIGTNVLMTKLRGTRIKTHGVGVATVILLLAISAEMSACQSEQSSPAASDALPQDQAQAPEMSPREQMIHRRAVEVAVLVSTDERPYTKEQPFKRREIIMKHSYGVRQS